MDPVAKLPLAQLTETGFKCARPLDIVLGRLQDNAADAVWVLTVDTHILEHETGHAPLLSF